LGCLPRVAGPEGNTTQAAGGGQKPPVGRKRQRTQLFRVGRLAILHQLAPHLEAQSLGLCSGSNQEARLQAACSPIPDLDTSVFTSRSQGVAVGRNSHEVRRGHGVRSLEPSLLLPANRFPW